LVLVSLLIGLHIVEGL
jgi:hypothetical protein